MACFANLPMISSPNPNPNPNLKASASLSQSSISTKLHFSSQFSSLSPSPLSLRCNQTLILRRFGGRAPSVSPTLVVCVAVFHFVNFDLSRFLPFSAFVSTLGKFGENFWPLLICLYAQKISVLMLNNIKAWDEYFIFFFPFSPCSREPNGSHTESIRIVLIFEVNNEINSIS